MLQCSQNNIKVLYVPFPFWQNEETLLLLYIIFSISPSETQHRVTSAYHHQSNCSDERPNQTLQQALANLTKDQLADWCCHLQSVLFAYNTLKQASTGYTPFEMMYDRKEVLPVEIQYTSGEVSGIDRNIHGIG